MNHSFPFSTAVWNFCFWAYVRGWCRLTSDQVVIVQTMVLKRWMYNISTIISSCILHHVFLYHCMFNPNKHETFRTIHHYFFASFDPILSVNGNCSETEQLSWSLYESRLLMAEILHQLIGSLSRYLQGFIHPRWCRISKQPHHLAVPSEGSTFANASGAWRYHQ